MGRAGNLIAYYLDKSSSGYEDQVKKFSGDITFSSNNRIFLHTKDFKHSTVRNRATIFDDSTTPPTLIREHYEISELIKLGADIPPTYIDKQGNIRRKDGEIVMRGPSE